MDDPRRKFYHPYTPYDIQLELMGAIYDTLSCPSVRVGIFESPTGTGKTLSVICACMTWLRESQQREIQTAVEALQFSPGEPPWVCDHARRLKQQQLESVYTQLETHLEQARHRVSTYKKKSVARHKRPRDDEDRFLPQEEDHATFTGLSVESQRLLTRLDSHAQDPLDQIKQTPKLVFASRTHSQLSQFVGQLAEPVFPCSIFSSDTLSGVRHVSLASRKQLCVHPEISRISNVHRLNEACQDARRNQHCGYFPRDESSSNELRDYILAGIRDIEDLVLAGKSAQECPYYASRSAVPLAETISIPYQLLLMPSARDSLGLDLRDCVVVIDEAHNLPDTITDMHSFTVTNKHVSIVHKGLETYMKRFFSRLGPTSKLQISLLIKLLATVDKYLANALANASCDTKACTEVTANEILANTNAHLINMSSLQEYIASSKLVYKLESYWGEEDLGPMNPSTLARRVFSFLTALSNPAQEGKIFLSKTSGPSVSASLNYLLLDPSAAFQQIVALSRKVIFVGGTMSPISEFLETLVPSLEASQIRQFSCRHIIPPENLMLAVLDQGFDKSPFHFTFDNRRNKTMTHSLGTTLCQLIPVTPSGVVVFFPSFQFMESMVEAWQQAGLIKQMKTVKRVHIEKSINQQRTPQSSDVLTAYSRDARDGAILFAVVGGKLSEGINFSDHLARAILIVGLPFPNAFSTEMIAKRKHVHARAVKCGCTADEATRKARDFYETICMRAVNQSIGRAIRHAQDYAVILLLDQRYAQPRIQSKLPSWMLQSLASKNLPQEVKSLMRSFYARTAAESKI